MISVFVFIIQMTFIVLRLVRYTDWPWFLVLMPSIITCIFIIGMITATIAIAIKANKANDE